MASKILVDELAPQSHATDVTLTTGKKIAGANTQFKVTGGASGNVLTTDGLGALTWGAPAALFVSYALIVDEKTSGTGGGTFTSGAWQTRDLQTEIFDPDGIVSIATNAFTLAAGSYFIKWSASASKVDNHLSRLYDITGAASVQTGRGGYVNSSYWGQGISDGGARVTPSGSNVYRIEHRCQTTQATIGFGQAVSFSVPYSFTSVEIFKES
jgi:hypothetical protein